MFCPWILGEDWKGRGDKVFIQTTHPNEKRKKAILKSIDSS
jgi:hypothetical protein